MTAALAYSNDVVLVSPTHLEQLEQIVRDGLQSFMAVGLALIEIRDSCGYRLRGFATFEMYTESTFAFTARHGRRMMAAAATAQEVAGLTGQRVKNEGVARLLAPMVHDANAIRHVQARLEARGQTFGSAPAAAVAGVLQEMAPRPEDAQRLARPRGECPACHLVPRAYRCVDGVWQCGSCGEEINIFLKLKRQAKAYQLGPADAQAPALAAGETHGH